MALPNKKMSLPANEERRRFQRVRVHLLGRYMLPDRREFPCQVIKIVATTVLSRAIRSPC
jgi:hypothetical protein